jgi:hypothetical protein
VIINDIINYIAENPSWSNITLINENMIALNKLRLPHLPTIYSHAMPRTDYKVPRMMIITKKTRQCLSDKAIIQLDKEFLPKKETKRKENSDTKTDPREPVEFHVSAMKLDFQFGSKDSTELISSFLNSKN